MDTSIEKRRNHGIVIFEDSIKGFTNFIIPFAVAMFPALKSGKLGSLLVAVGVFLAFFGIETVYSLAAWFFKTFSIENGVFRLQYGVFVKKNREIPVNKIVTVQEMQTLIQRVFRVWTVKLDTGSSQIKEAEAKLVVAEHDLALIRHLLAPQRANEIKEQPEEASHDQQSQIVYRSDRSSLVKLGLTSNAIFAGIAVIFSLFQFLSDFFEEQINEFLGQAQNIIESSAIKLTLRLLFMLGLVLIAYSLISLGAAVVSSLVKYHDFRILRQNDSIIIQYGLFKRNSFTIPQNKINAVYIKQSIIRQWFGLASVHIESIGYGNEKGEEALLVPLAGLEEVNGILSGILDSYSGLCDAIPVPRRSLRRFIIGVLIYPLILILPISLFYPFGYLSLILVPFILWSAFLQYRHSKVGWNNEALFLNYGGYNRIYARIRRKGIQAVMKKATPFQRMAKLFSLHISIQGNMFGKILSVKHLDSEVYENIKELV